MLQIYEDRRLDPEIFKQGAISSFLSLEMFQHMWGEIVDMTDMDLLIELEMFLGRN